MKKHPVLSIILFICLLFQFWYNLIYRPAQKRRELLSYQEFVMMNHGKWQTTLEPDLEAGDTVIFEFKVFDITSEHDTGVFSTIK